MRVLYTDVCKYSLLTQLWAVHLVCSLSPSCLLRLGVECLIITNTDLPNSTDFCVSYVNQQIIQELLLLFDQFVVKIVVT